MKLNGEDNHGVVLLLYKYQANLKAQICRCPIPWVASLAAGSDRRSADLIPKPLQICWDFPWNGALGLWPQSSRKEQWSRTESQAWRQDSVAIFVLKSRRVTLKNRGVWWLYNISSFGEATWPLICQPFGFSFSTCGQCHTTSWPKKRRPIPRQMRRDHGQEKMRQ